MKSLCPIVGLALVLSVAPVDAKHKNKIKTVIGCVDGTQNHYQLSTTTKKGKSKVYQLIGRDFQSEVGHRVQAHGAASQGTLKVTSLKDVGATCR
jgi:hypothetical protein